MIYNVAVPSLYLPKSQFFENLRIKVSQIFLCLFQTEENVLNSNLSLILIQMFNANHTKYKNQADYILNCFTWFRFQLIISHEMKSLLM